MYGEWSGAKNQLQMAKETQHIVGKDMLAKNAIISKHAVH